MKIAVLGWGSLIWDPRNLKIDKSFGKNGWDENGPKLPIEFARISSDGRLTLVIKEGCEEINTLYAISAYNELEVAVLDLAIREVCGRNRIASYQRANQELFPNNINRDIRKCISVWIYEKQDIDAVIWTNLKGNFQDKMGCKISEENVIDYLKNLPLDIQAKAEEYIRKAPSVVNTVFRRSIEKELKWKNI